MDQFISILYDEELIRFTRRCQMRNKHFLGFVLKHELDLREERERIEYSKVQEALASVKTT